MLAFIVILHLPCIVSGWESYGSHSGLMLKSVAASLSGRERVMASWWGNGVGERYGSCIGIGEILRFKSVDSRWYMLCFVKVIHQIETSLRDFFWKMSRHFCSTHKEHLAIAWLIDIPIFCQEWRLAAAGTYVSVSVGFWLIPSTAQYFDEFSSPLKDRWSTIVS